MILPFHGLDISRNDSVLEIGSGHSPSYCSDVLCDKYLTDDERIGPLKVDRPFFQADCQALPFQDKSFDYIICRQVLEHVDDPLKCCRELSRVGKKGYIETPALFWEKLHPTRVYHRWFVLAIDDTLVFYSKDHSEYSSLFGKLFEIMYANSLEYHLFFRAYRKLFEVRFEWQNEIKCLVNPTDEYYGNLFEKAWDIDEYKRFYGERSFGRQAIDLNLNLFSFAALYLLSPLRIALGNLIRDQRKGKLGSWYGKH